MTLRRSLYLRHLLMALLIGFVGFVAYVTLDQLREVLRQSDRLTPPLATLLGRADLIVLVVTALGIVVALGLGVYAVRSIAHPLHRLVDATRELSRGTLTADIPASGPGEIGQLAAALNDMTEAIRRRTVSRSYLNNILDSMAEMLFVVDASGTIQRINRAAQERLDYDETELEGRALSRLFDDEQPWSPAEASSLQRQGYTHHTERVLRTKKGHTLPVLFSRAALRSDRDDLEGIVCVAQDISERKAAEEQIKASLREKEVLLREIHHRVKNNLQVISSLLHLQSKSVDGAEAQQLFSESQNRIRSMALIHERLYQSDDLAQVDFAAYLDRLTEHLLHSYNARPNDITLDLQAETSALSVDQAIPCGLIVNELVTNALKHAFPDGDGGTITVTFTRTGDGARLSVADTGPDPPSEADLRESDSLGFKLVRGLVQQLNGTMEVSSDPGLRLSIHFPSSSA